MAKERISERMQSQIKVLKAQGASIRKMARALGISRQSVRKFAREEEGKKEPTVQQPTEKTAWFEQIDWAKVGELSKSGVTVKQLHIEFAPDATYWSFWSHLRRATPVAKEVTLRIEHKPGERVELDYADGIDVIDAASGEVRRTHLFMAVLPFSSYAYGEFAFSQKLTSFIDSQERMWRFFRGITPYVVIDNLKAGVIRAHRYDPDVNPTYCEYANHMGFAVLPARPRKPRDKATIEANIGAVQRSFYQEVREKHFYSLAELNAAFWAFVGRFNRLCMKDHGVSRAQRFEVERGLLKSIPDVAFEFAEWRQAKVHPDCHIQVERNFYSVPYRLAGQSVRVRVGAKVVEVFDAESEAVAAHPRLSGIGKMSTQEQHYPDRKLGIKRFEVRAAQAQASKIGPHTGALVETLIAGDYPLKHLRRIQGILRLNASGHVSNDGLEYACKQAAFFGKPRLQYIKACAEHFDANGARLKVVKPDREADTVYLHGDNEDVAAGGGQ